MHTLEAVSVNKLVDITVHNLMYCTLSSTVRLVVLLTIDSTFNSANSPKKALWCIA